MTHERVTGSSPWVGLLALAALVATPACVAQPEAEIAKGVGEVLACAFRFDSATTVHGEQDALQAAIDCGDSTDCSDRRTVMSGLELSVSLDVSGFASDSVTITTDNPKVISLEGFSLKNDVCKQGPDTRVQGRLRFAAVGTASLIVAGDRQEIDRFTWSAYEPASLSVNATRYRAEAPTVDSSAIDSLELRVGDAAILQARVANDQDVRLLTGPRFAWSIEGVAGSDVDTHEPGRSFLYSSDEPGEADVRVAIAALEHTVHIVVLPAP